MAFAAERALLPGHVPTLVHRAKGLERLESRRHLQLAVGLPLRNKLGLLAWLEQVYDPGSQYYRQFLTSAQFTAQYGPTEAEYQAVVDYFKANGLAICGTHPNRLVLDVVGPVSAIERAFQTTLRLYQHPTEDRTFFAPEAEPSVKAGVPVLDVSGLDDSVLPHPMNLRRASSEQRISSNATGSGPGGTFLGKDFRAAYAPGVQLTGVGQVIGLFQFGPYFSNNIPVYQQYAGLPTNTVVTNILLNGLSGIPAPGADDGEQALDIEMAMSMAPGAIIAVYEGTSAYDILNRIATDNWAKQIGCSWGFLPAPSGMDNILLQFAAQGQTLFVASGDAGAYSASQPIYAPMDNPYATSVGGTVLTTTGAGGSWMSETAWGGSGGGYSRSYGIPTWQQGVSMALNHGSTTQRNFPDVAMLAEPVIFFVYRNGLTGTVGGTSAAAPLWAGLMALVNQQAAANGRSSVGAFNQAVYALGSSAAYDLCFHDITSGSNTNGGSPTNFFAQVGYDLCTGWGSPNGSNLIHALAGPTDSLRVSPGVGFTVVTPYAVPFRATEVTFLFTNAGADALNWSVGNTSVWFTVSTLAGTLAAESGEGVTVSLNPGATELPVGYHYATLWITNLNSRVVQTRLFTLVVSSASWPLEVNGFNAGVILAKDATPTVPMATAFDLANNYSLYEAGLSGGTKGLPASGEFVSQADNQTLFRFGPYGATNALLLGYTYPTSRTLTLKEPKSYNSLAILAASANGGGLGTLVVNFTNGTRSQTLSFNAPDWYNTTANVAIQGFGRVGLGSSFTFEDPGTKNPNLYQTILNLGALGLNQPVASIAFTKPNIGGTQSSAIFAVSGARMSPQVVLTQQPQSLTNNVSSQAATLNVIAMGAPPLSYQWFFSASGVPGSYAALEGQTGSSLTFSPAQTNHTGNYCVVVTNAFGSVTSAVATLTVYRAPVIVRQPGPASVKVFAGQSLTFSVTANAALPISYYWNQNGTNVAWATNSSCAFTNLQLSHSGAYSALVSNAFGTATSSVVVLTVLALPSYPYAQAVLADGPVGYWRLDESTGLVAHDSIAARNGVFNNVALGLPGYELLDPHTSARFGYLASTYSFVTNGAVGFATASNAAFSVEAWVNGGPQPGDSGLITKGTGGGGEQFNLDCGGPGHAFRFLVRDASAGAHTATSSVLPGGKWHHVVGVCDPARSNILLYVDGTNAARGAINPGVGILSSPNPVSFGSRQSGSTVYDLQFVGDMEEVAIYRIALSAAQVQAHFRAVTNRPPAFLLDPLELAAANAGQAYSASIATKASDPNGDALVYAKVSGPAWLAVDAGGALAGTPLSGDVGLNVFTVSASDPLGLSASAGVSIFVNPAPTICAAVWLEGVEFVLTWSGGIAPYRVEWTTNLLHPDWQDLAGPLVTNGLRLAPSADAAFYRVVGR